MEKLNIIQKTKCLSTEYLLKYLNDNLTNKQSYDVEKHLLDCKMCQAQLDGLTEMKNKNNLSNIINDLNIQIDKRTSKKNNIKPFSVSKTQKRLKIYKYFAIAASFILLIGLSVLIGKYVTDLNETTLAENINTKSETITNERELTEVTDEVDNEIDTNAETIKKENIPAENKQVQENINIDEVFNEDVEEDDIILTDNDIQDDESFEYEVVDDRIQGDVVENIETEEQNISPNRRTHDKNSELEKNKGVSLNEESIATIVADEVKVKKNRKKLFDFNKKTSKANVTGDVDNSQNLQERSEKTELQQKAIIDSGIYFYNNQEYPQAVSNFNTVIEQESTNSVALYYTAQCYQQTNDNRNALVYYNKITDNKNDEFYYNAQYNKALVLIDMGKEKKATTILQELSEENNLFQDSAKVKLLEIQ